VDIDWTKELLDQMSWQWDTALRPRLDTIDDEAYRWEPVDGTWGIRRRSEARSGRPQGAGDVVMDLDLPSPDPAPLTTVAWRMGHVAMVFGERAANHFGNGGVSYSTTRWPSTVDGMRSLLDEHHDAWVAGVRALDGDDLGRPCGPAEGPYAEAPMASLVLHVHREVLHHGAEIALMMDLFAHRDSLGGSR
jgi:DinB superfamily